MPARAAMIKAVLALPGAKLLHPWGTHDAAIVNGHYFAFMGKADNKPDAPGLSVKLPESGEAALKAKQVERMKISYMTGWYSVPHAKIEDLPLATLKAWLRESHAFMVAKPPGKCGSSDTPHKRTKDSIAAAQAPKKAAANKKAAATKATKKAAATKTTKQATRASTKTAKKKK
eukprot:CAMPEP_0174856192 /NCGR_PEP_ID=MMETSP1114-20130205/35309_1 /TAXON_ID=312471 /ORGANISM="Neobodo designis, Strain CCAP 1951/1" /LENGTH=173 /DNA_ID=CAMNT_0016090977 /DNA_START=42 /DNA_END=563 /DNA_ORIENTATION=+